MTAQKSLTSSKSKTLSGAFSVPGDKSISHRALMFGGLAIGETKIKGLLEGEDVLHTAAAMRALGAKITRDDQGFWQCYGVGIGGLCEPEETLNMGNSGTGARLLLGLIAGHPITCFFDGDASLRKRPMNRVIKPLEMIGAEFTAREGGRLPLSIKGSDNPLPIEYRLPVASAQVKSAVLLAGLSAPGATTVIEEKPTRDHTEKLLQHFGVRVDVEQQDNGDQVIDVYGQKDLKGCAVNIPGDPSSAAFPIAAVLMNEGSKATFKNIGMNDRRIGLFKILQEMGAAFSFDNQSTEAGEPVADIIVEGTGPLQAINVPPDIVPSMIDEFPIFAMVAACANGTTRMTGLEELRVKESDRLLVVAKGLEASGVKIDMGEDSLTIYGNGKPPKGGSTIKTELDHRIAMSFLTLGTVTEDSIAIDDAAPIETSFPGFKDLMLNLGAEIS